MSEKAVAELPSSELKKGDNVCRDFVRNVCRRGDRCKFSHPAGSGGGTGEGGAKLQDKMEFCHDYQNGRCTRPQCKFIHCSSDIEAEFKTSGYLPPAVREQVISKGVAVDFPATAGGVPICKDFLKGVCARDTRCKFRHVNAMEYDLEMNAYQQAQHPGQMMSRRRPHPGMFYDAGEEEGLQLYDRRHDNKRRCVVPNYGGGVDMTNMVGQQGGPPPHAFQMLQDENLQLRTQLQELEKRVSDLTATNEFLLDQNAQLRMGVKQPGLTTPASVSVSGTMGPCPVSVSGLGAPSSANYCY